MIKRRNIDNLRTWFQNSRRKPLILRGARQVGKSTLVRQFALGQQLDLLEINLERYPHLDGVFQTNDTAKIFRELEVVFKRPILRDRTLLFLDEIQATPHALPALRYFYEDHPNLPVVAAGSLLEFVLAEHDFSMPVGRIEYHHLGPVSFGEFLMTLGEEDLFDKMSHYDGQGPWPMMAHQKLVDYQRQYLFVGGMPESVAVYAQDKNLSAVENVHRSILNTYRDDFFKYSKAGTERRLLHHIFTVMPNLVGKKIKYVNISREDRAAEARSALFLLVKARLLIEDYHTNAAGIPLKAGRHDKIYKVFFVDIGLLNHLFGLAWSHLFQLNDKQLVNEGVMAEQFVAQHLAYASGGLEEPELHYWLSEGKGRNAELDFLLQVGNKIVPIEVKSGAGGSLKSLQQFVDEKKIDLACRLDLNMPSLQTVEVHLTRALERKTRFCLLSLPLYFAEFVPKILRNF